MTKPRMPMEVDGLTIIRQAMIDRRTKSMKEWPEGIEDSLLFSHAIAWLSYCQELEKWIKEKGL